MPLEDDGHALDTDMEELGYAELQHLQNLQNYIFSKRIAGNLLFSENSSVVEYNILTSLIF